MCVGVQSEETPTETLAAADVLVDGPRGVRACSRPSRSPVRFVDLLRTAVMLSAGAATMLAIVTARRRARRRRPSSARRAGWWIVAALIGTFVGRTATGRHRSPVSWPTRKRRR